MSILAIRLFSQRLHRPEHHSPTTTSIRSAWHRTSAIAATRGVPPKHHTYRFTFSPTHTLGRITFVVAGSVSSTDTSRPSRSQPIPSELDCQSATIPKPGIRKHADLSVWEGSRTLLLFLPFCSASVFPVCVIGSRMERWWNSRVQPTCLLFWPGVLLEISLPEGCNVCGRIAV